MHKSIDLCDGLTDQYIEEIENFIAEWESQSEFIEVHTSGSTGKPKVIQLAKSQIEQSALATGKFFNFKSGDRILLNLSPNYIAGKLMLVRALIHDMRILVAPLDQNPLINLPYLEIDFAAFVPYQIQAILSNPDTAKKYEKLKKVIIGGAPLNPEWTEKIAALSNANYATFGMTETITHFALKRIAKDIDFYTCLPGIHISTDQRGCLVIEKNQITDRLVTNDLITLIDTNRFIWKGRFDHVINSGGIKISPEEVEQKLAGLLKGYNYFIIGRKNETYGEEVVLYIEGKKATNLEQLASEIQQVLNRYEQPKAIYWVSLFDRTATDKIIRKNYY